MYGSSRSTQQTTIKTGQVLRVRGPTEAGTHAVCHWGTSRLFICCGIWGFGLTFSPNNLPLFRTYIRIFFGTLKKVGVWWFSRKPMNWLLQGFAVQRFRVSCRSEYQR